MMESIYGTMDSPVNGPRDLEAYKHNLNTLGKWVGCTRLYLFLWVCYYIPGNARYMVPVHVYIKLSL